MFKIPSWNFPNPPKKWEGFHNWNSLARRKTILFIIIKRKKNWNSRGFFGTLHDLGFIPENSRKISGFFKEIKAKFPEKRRDYSMG